ncbi:hypothetical protein [Labilibaculum euxinus]|uniref:Uncharacterized protein n=1 Tax=Labilibaculum euxinus TaxID=2686357 RepID=A0A7M4D7W0_9BACT|nr:hypothetical protein [Labilibaculum euxinus]MUP38739.1 hypothetical protein [Labilibaculum euxinus]MVB07944.1 hypothetical protein [Labilibaculum euxinus]
MKCIFQLRLLLVCVLCYMLNGCEYELENENVLNIEEPAELQTFDLTLTSSGQALEIFEVTELNYDVSMNNYNVIKAKISLQDKTWEFESTDSGSCIIDPKDFENGIDTIVLSVFFHSGSGSIADYSRLEGYYVERKWPVTLDGRNAPTLVPTKRINENGFLEIEWPVCDQYNFVNYEINTYSNKGIIKITDPSQTTYIDSLYVGGDFSIRVGCNVVDNYNSGKVYNFYEELPKPIFEEIGFKQVRISWKKSPYPAQYDLRWGEENRLCFSPNDTSCIIPQKGFGEMEYFYLCTKSVYAKNWSDFSFPDYLTTSAKYHLGERLISANWPEFAYNKYSKTIYSSEYDDVKSFTIDDYSQISKVKIDYLLSGCVCTCPTNSSKMATISNNRIYVFEDENLDNCTEITYKTRVFQAYDHFLMTNNDLIAVAYNYIYELIDMESKKVIASLKLSDYPQRNKYACISTTQNAKHMCVATSSGIKIYAFENGKLTETYSDSKDYESAYFDPMNSSRLYLILDDEAGIEVRNPLNFELLDKINIESGYIIQNIDPETNNLLVKNNNILLVIDTKTHEILYGVPCTERKGWLYNNHLFIDNGYGLDLSKF